MTHDEWLIQIERVLSQDLTTLDLRSKNITTLPAEIGQLTQLQHLNLWGNRLTSLPPEIGQLVNLKELVLADNPLQTLPSEIGNLHNLGKIDLHLCHLTELPPTIGKLINLKEINLSNNKLITLPPEIGRLNKLVSLRLGGNQIASIPEEIGQFTNLEWLDISGNKLQTLPQETRNLINLKKLRVYGNNLQLPNHVVGHFENPNNPQTLLKAYFDTKYPLVETKLLVIGEPDVGKTTLVKQLLRNDFLEIVNTTSGIIFRTTWPIKDHQTGGLDKLYLNIWDFGEQEIYHPTQRFLMTEGGLYLLVLDAHKDEVANRLDNWLAYVESFDIDAHIIVVINKSDIHSRILDERKWKQKYPSIIEFVTTSCKTEQGLGELRTIITRAAAKMLDITHLFPLAWLNIKEKLSKCYQEKNVIEYDDYCCMCRDEEITKEGDQKLLLQFLHKLGVAFHFHDDHRLKDDVFNPQWIIKGISKIFTALSLQNYSIFKRDDLNDILDHKYYPRKQQLPLLDVMCHVKLCVEIDKKLGHYHVGDLLPLNESDGVNTRPNLDKIELFEKLKKRFNLAELKTLAFQLEIEYENFDLKHENFARELVEFCARHQRLEGLNEKINEERPHLQ